MAAYTAFDPCNIYRDGHRGVGYPADPRSVGDGHPSCSLRRQIAPVQISNFKPQILRFSVHIILLLWFSEQRV